MQITAKLNVKKTGDEAEANENQHQSVPATGL